MEPIATATKADLERETAAAWDRLEAAIRDAEPQWDDRILAAEDAGDSAWSPRLAAWHAIAGELIRAAYLHHLVADSPDDLQDMMAFAASGAVPDVSNESLRSQYQALAAHADMQHLAASTRKATLDAIAALTPEDLDRQALLSSFVHDYLRSHGQGPSDTVRGSLLHGIVHLRDHAAQVQAGIETGQV